MKSVVVLFFILFSNICSAQIPNNSFENWNIVGNDTTISDGWRGNKATVLERIFVYSQQGTISREAHEGSFFIKLNHADTLGTINSLGYLEAKFPCTGRPKSLTFSGMYFPQLQGEGFGLVITLTKNSGDTISHTTSNFGTITVTNWSNLSTNIIYNTSAVGDPDSCYIRFQLLPTNTNKVNINTMLLIDALRFNNFSVSVDEELSTYDLPKNINVYPNPANSLTSFSFDLNIASNVEVSILSIDGKEVLSSAKYFSVGNAKLDLDISALKSGLYLYKVKSNNNTVHGKLNIVH